MMGGLKIKAADYLVIGILVFWGLAGFWLNLQPADAAERKYAAVFVQNEKVAELSIVSGNQFTHTLEFGEQNEYSALIEIKDNRIRMLPLSKELCPRAVCSHTGWIEYTYESIVCLPNRIVIVFSEPAHSGGDNVIDGITY